MGIGSLNLMEEELWNIKAINIDKYQPKYCHNLIALILYICQLIK